MSCYTWRRVCDGSWLKTYRDVWLMHESCIGFGLRCFSLCLDGVVC